MSRTKRLLLSLGLLVALAVLLYSSFQITANQPDWVRVVVAAVLCGFYGMAQRYLRERK